MSLLAILISLSFEKLMPVFDRLRPLEWFSDYSFWLRQRLRQQKHWQGIAVLLLVVLSPVLLIAIIQYLLYDALVFSSFLFSIVILLYCLGPKDQHRLVHQYLKAIEDDDTETAQTLLKEILQVDMHEPLPEDEQAQQKLLAENILITTHDRMLGVLFWFVILGPMGAVLYRLTLELLYLQKRIPETDNADFNAVSLRLYYLLAWIPSRLTMFSYAVMGNFVQALNTWRENCQELTEYEKHEEQDSSSTNTLPKSHHNLICLGLSALQFDHSNMQDSNIVRETLGLCGRSLIFWVSILALLTLAGWAS